jgi:hypothetical protein
MGMNLTLKTISIIDRLIDYKHHEVDDLIEGFSQYNYKYLAKNSIVRFKRFINTLKAIQKAYLHPVRIKQLNGSLYNKLLTNNSEIKYVNVYAELIPFGQIWELILEIPEDSKEL